MQKKIARLRKLWRADRWSIIAWAASMIPIYLLDRDSGPYFIGLMIICFAVWVILWIFLAVFSRKLLRCPYCLRYSPAEVEKFLQGKEETFLCPPLRQADTGNGPGRKRRKIKKSPPLIREGAVWFLGIFKELFSKRPLKGRRGVAPTARH